ncbi:MAG: hypothetical protein FWD83_03780 [Promicromonosporaceae bacterium]|nr:hypothetical protein [Promicromonosporaceae bacterium]
MSGTEFTPGNGARPVDPWASPESTQPQPFAPPQASEQYAPPQYLYEQPQMFYGQPQPGLPYPQYAPPPYGQGAKPDGWASLPLVVAALGGLSIAFLFLPVVSIFGMSFHYFNAPGGGEDGYIVLVFSLVVIGLAIGASYSRKKGLVIASGVVGIISSLVGMAAGFGNIPAAFAGAGPILLGLASIALLVLSIIVLATQRRIVFGKLDWPYQSIPPHLR